jgi:hypothetical protein
MKRWGCSLFVLVLLPAAVVRAGPEDDDLPSDIWRHPGKAAAVTAVQLVATTDPFTRAATRIGAFDRDLWDEPPLWLDKVPPLSRGRLSMVRDDTPFGNFPDLDPEEIPREALAEDTVYWQAVVYASKVPADVFAKAARVNKHLTFGHLYTEPAKYRGMVVHMEGRLGRLKRLDPPLYAQRKGVGVLYEGWIFLDRPGTHPVTVLFPHKPANLAEGERLNERVTFDGYFFKRWRYKSGMLDEDKNNVDINTVALIGPTVNLVVRAGGGDWSMHGSGTLLEWILGFVGGVALLVLALSFWFKNNDRKVKARLLAMQSDRFAAPVEMLEPLPEAADTTEVIAIKVQDAKMRKPD